MAERWQQWMPFHIDRFRGSPEVQAMHPAARSGFLYLLASAWQTDDCSISSDPIDLATESGLGDELWAQYGPRILRKFELVDGRYRNPVLFQEWSDALAVYDKRKAGAVRTNSVRSPNAERTQSERNTDTVTGTTTGTETKTTPLASTAVAVPAARGVLRGVLPLSGNRTYEVCDDDYARDGPLYPGIDLTHEYRGMKAWLLANPKHQKTPQGIRRFMNTWLSKAQDKSKPQGAGNGTAFKSKSESTIEALHANHEGRRNRDPFGDVVSGAAGECEEAGVRPVYAIPDAVRTEAHQDSNRAVVIEATR